MLDLIHLISAVIAGMSSIVALMILIMYPKLPFSLKWMGLYCVVGASSDLLMIAHAYVSKHNLYLFHFYVLLEFFFLTVFFFQVYKDLGRPMKRNLFLTLGLILIIGNTLFLQPLNTFNSYSSTIVSLVFIGFCIYFFSIILDKNINTIEFKTLKWLVITTFIFHSVSFVVLMFSNKIQGLSVDLSRIIWTVRAVVLLIVKLIVLFHIGKLFFHYLKKPQLINGRE